MTRQKQKLFVTEIFSIIQKEILARISSNKIPNTWDGIELRLYISDKMSEIVMKDLFTRKRLKERLPKLMEEFYQIVTFFGFQY